MTIDTETILIILIVLIVVFTFLYNTQVGIKIGYWLNGGEKIKSVERDNSAAMLRDYNEYRTTYEKYKDSTNPTALGWAESAKEKANIIADKYNMINENNKLNKIGE